MSLPSLSIVVPVYNEEQRLSLAFDALDRLAQDHGFSALEIIFVDDGSKDRTKELIQGFRTNCPVRLVSYKPNAGKGAAVRAGMLAAAHDYALMIDVDMSTPMDQVAKFLPFMHEGYPVIIGTRKDKTADVRKRQPAFRQKLGEVFTLLARIMTGVPVTDFTCGFKCFSKDAIRRIFPNTIIDRWSYDAEILFLAKHATLPIVEVGVTWINDERSRVRLWRDVSRSLYDLFRIRTHRYDDRASCDRA
jgi:dolichyl-phosphate beta-glucosyltransferase